jgi:hypothetical protein
MGTELPDTAFFFIRTVYTKSFFEKRKGFQIHRPIRLGAFCRLEEKRTIRLL